MPVGAGIEAYSNDEETESDSDGEDTGEPVKMMLCVNQEVYRDGKKTKMRPGKVAAQCGQHCSSPHPEPTKRMLGFIGYLRLPYHNHFQALAQPKSGAYHILRALGIVGEGKL